MCSDWKDKKSSCVSSKQTFLLLGTNKLNYSKAKKNEKSRDTVQQI